MVNFVVDWPLKYQKSVNAVYTDSQQSFFLNKKLWLADAAKMLLEMYESKNYLMPHTKKHHATFARTLTNRTDAKLKGGKTYDSKRGRYFFHPADLGQTVLGRPSA